MTARARPATRMVVAVLTVAVALTGCATTTAGSPQHPATSATGHVRPAAVPAADARSTPVTKPKPKPKPNACATNTSAQLVKVSVHRQHLWLCAYRHLAYSTPITSGMVGEYTSTPTGDYAIQGRDRNTVLTLITGDQYTVKYWIPFDAPLFGFHDSSWQDFPYGSSRYRTQGSHGCVHMPLKAIAFLYNWADIGAKVTIRA